MVQTYHAALPEVVLKKYPHTDYRVLHAPGSCVRCDLVPELQDYRLRMNISFTGNHEAGKRLCPAEQERDISTILCWTGNREVPHVANNG